MSSTELSGRARWTGVVIVWVAAVLMGLVVGLFAPIGQRAGWVSLALGGCLILSFAVQLGIARPEGFIERVASSMLGSFVILGVIGGVFGLIAINAA